MKEFVYIALLLLTLSVSACSNPKDYKSLPDNTAASLDDPVYITMYGHRYHKKKCWTLSNHNVKIVNRSDAESIGRTPCHVCHP